MKTEIELLVSYLTGKDLKSFEKNLRPELINTFEVYTVYQYHTPYSGYDGLKKKEIQRRLLIFYALEHQSYHAFRLLLEQGADLLLYESYETFDYVSGGLSPKPIKKYTNMALKCISESEDNRFIQMTFDHICEKDLCKNRIYINFIIRHIREVNRDKFDPKYLYIDVGTPLPVYFKTMEEYQTFLIEASVNISAIFFTKRDYLILLLDPSKIFDKRFLNHALSVSDFKLDELKKIYESLKSDELKRTVEDFNPEVNPEFLSELNALCQAEEEKQSPLKRRLDEHSDIPASSAPAVVPSKPVIQITSVQKQEYEHLKSRIKRLEERESQLRQNLSVGKKRKKDTDDLASVLKSLKNCRESFFNNPCFALEASDKNDEKIDENSISL